MATVKNDVTNATFDHDLFLDESERRLRADSLTRGRYHSVSRPNFDRMLTFMETDVRLTDLRWMAYMFGTAYLEAAELVMTGRRANGNPIRNWSTVMPTDEDGRVVNRRYGRPVKVLRLGLKSGRITEWEGDVITITNGRYTIGRGQNGGANYDANSHQTYRAAEGNILSYYGRGYVQLTWCYNYARASLAIGLNYTSRLSP